MIDLNELNWKQTSAGTWLVLVYANYCGKCRKGINLLSQAKLPLDVNLSRLNGMNNGGLTLKLNIEAVPTLLLIKNGKEVKRWKGLPTVSEIERSVRNEKSDVQNEVLRQKHGRAL